MNEFFLLPQQTQADLRCRKSKKLTHSERDFMINQGHVEPIVEKNIFSSSVSIDCSTDFLPPKTKRENFFNLQYSFYKLLATILSISFICTLTLMYFFFLCEKNIV